VKTNRLDSRKLSTQLRGGELRSIHVPSQVYRELRHLVQLRDAQVGQLTATKCPYQVAADLRRHSFSRCEWSLVRTRIAPVNDTTMQPDGAL
jgi:hypothetical protein